MVQESLFPDLPPIEVEVHKPKRKPRYFIYYIKDGELFFFIYKGHYDSFQTKFISAEKNPRKRPKTYAQKKILNEWRDYAQEKRPNERILTGLYKKETFHNDNTTRLQKETDRINSRKKSS